METEKTKEQLKQLACEVREISKQMGLEVPQGGNLIIILYPNGRATASIRTHVDAECNPKKE